MTGQTLSLNPNCSSSAFFRAWGSAISTAIGVNGQVQTADTGQINWTTVTVPAAGAVGGYEIWRFADTLQSAAPVYFKIEYGLGGNSAPQIWITIGTGSDGAGTITGTVSGVTTPQIAVRQNISPTSGAATNVATTSYVNGDSGCLAMFLWPNNNTSAWYGMMLIIERTRDGSGAATGDGLMCLIASATNGTTVSGCCLLGFLPGVRLTQTALTWPAAWPIVNWTGNSTIQTMASGGALYPAFVYTGTGPKACGPSQYVMAVAQGDVPLNQTISITHYGTARNWLTAGNGNTASSLGWGSLGANDMTVMKSFIFRIN